MGPTNQEFGDLPEVPGVDHAPDHAARAAEFVRRHGHVSITATAEGWTAAWVEADPDPRIDWEPMRATRDLLGHLVDYLEARFDRRPS